MSTCMFSRLRHLLPSVLILFAAASCSDDRPTPPSVTGAGTIEGQILAGDSGPSSPSIVSYEGAHDRRSRITNEEGLFLFPDAEAGHGRLWILPPPGFAIAEGQENPLDIFVPDGGVARIDILLAEMSDTTVVDSFSIGFIRIVARNGEFPAYGVHVRAVRDARVYGAGTIDEASYVVLATPEGNYTVEAIAPTWFRIVSITPGTVVVSAGEMSDAEVLVEQVAPLPPGGLEIFVANPDSVPVNDPVPAGIPVTVERLDGSGFTRSTETDGLGRAHLDLDAGTYRVSIEVPEGWHLWEQYPNPVEVEVRSATSTWARFYMSRPIN